MRLLSTALSGLLMAGTATVNAEDVKLILTTDPFRKPEFEQVDPAGSIALEEQPAGAGIPRLRAIMHSSQTTLVNLNGELVAVGERFENFLVAAAGERNVVLLKGEDSHVVSLDDEHGEAEVDD